MKETVYEGVKMQELAVPKLTWEERYRRMIDLAITYTTTYKVLLKERYGERIMQEISEKVQKRNASRCAKKLIQHYKLEPTVEDSIKLMYLYSCEVWGYGDSKYVSAYLQSSKKGVCVNHVCRIWEKRKEFGDAKRADCHIQTEAEYRNLVHQLAPHLKVYMGKAFPKGDNSCDIWVEEAEESFEME